MSYSTDVLKMHQAIVDMGQRLSASEVMQALALTVAYANRYCLDKGATIDQGLKSFNQLVLVEYFDPDSQMTKPKDLK